MFNELFNRDLYDLDDPKIQAAFGWGIHKDGDRTDIDNEFGQKLNSLGTLWPTTM